MNTLLFDLETTGLVALDSKITCISCKVHGSDEIKSFCGDFEAKILADFSGYVFSNNISKIVAYNGWSFDVPFLRVRAMRNSCKLPQLFWSEHSLDDPYHILARSKKGKQVQFAALVGIDDDDLFGDGKQCIEWFKKGDFDSISKHCESDIVALDRIYSRMVECGFVCR